MWSSSSLSILGTDEETAIGADIVTVEFVPLDTAVVSVPGMITYLNLTYSFTVYQRTSLGYSDNGTLYLILHFRVLGP
jgi:hypothetical protein